MRLSTINKVLLASVAVVVPLSIYGGISIKERYLERELRDMDRVPESKTLVSERAVRARVAQLEQERKQLVAERRDIELKLADVRARMGKGSGEGVQA